MYSDIPFWLSAVFMLGDLFANAYGSSNIFNITMILGIAVLIFPLVVRPIVSFVSGPGLAAISLFSLWVLSDGLCSRFEASHLCNRICRPRPKEMPAKIRKLALYMGRSAFSA